MQEYVIEGIPAEAVKVLSGDGFPVPRRNNETHAWWPRGLVLANIPNTIDDSSLFYDTIPNFV